MICDQLISNPLAAGVILLLIIWLCSYFWSKNRNLPPGPWGLPLLGYFPFIQFPDHLHFNELSKRYGPIFSFRTLGGHLVVILHDLKIAKEVLVNRSDEFIGRPLHNNGLAWISNGLGITQEEGAPWKEQRKFFLQTAKTFGFGKMESEGMIHHELSQMLDTLKDSAGKPTDVLFPITCAVSNVVSQILFKKTYTTDKAQFRMITKTFRDALQLFFNSTFYMLGVFFNMKLAVFPSLRNVEKSRKFIHQLTDAMLEDHIRNLDPNHPQDYVDAYLLQMKETKNKQNSYFTLDRLRANSLNLLLEGTESVSFAISELLKELSKHPDVQEEAQRELDVVIGRERPPSWLDRPKLPYIDAVIQELHRVVSIFPHSTIYSNFDETKIQGYRIPKRSFIITSFWALHNDPNIYPNPSKFNPRRFIDSEGKRIKLEGPFPFGLGKRACIGESLAQMEVFLVLTTILQHFRVLPGDSENTLRAIPRT